MTGFCPSQVTRVGAGGQATESAARAEPMQNPLCGAEATSALEGPPNNDFPESRDSAEQLLEAGRDPCGPLA